MTPTHPDPDHDPQEDTAMPDDPTPTADPAAEERRCSWCGSPYVTASTFGWRCIRCGWETDEERIER